MGIKKLQKHYLPNITHQVGRRPHLIFDFTWSGLKEAMKCSALIEVTRFRGALQHILRQVLNSNPCQGPVYLSKAYLYEAYRMLWVQMEDVLSLALLILKKNPSDPHMVGFYLSLPMGCVDSAPYFCMAT